MMQKFDGIRHFNQCRTAGDQLVAHYDVTPQYDPSVSGNYLTIYEDFFPLTLGAYLNIVTTEV